MSERTPKICSHLFGVSIKTLAMKRCDSSSPKFVKRGRVFRLPSDLDEWLRSVRVASTTEERTKKRAGLRAAPNGGY